MLSLLEVLLLFSLFPIEKGLKMAFFKQKKADKGIAWLTPIGIPELSFPCLRRFVYWWSRAWKAFPAWSIVYSIVCRANGYHPVSCRWGTDVTLSYRWPYLLKPHIPIHPLFADWRKPARLVSSWVTFRTHWMNGASLRINRSLRNYSCWNWTAWAASIDDGSCWDCWNWLS